MVVQLQLVEDLIVWQTGRLVVIRIFADDIFLRYAEWMLEVVLVPPDLTLNAWKIGADTDRAPCSGSHHVVSQHEGNQPIIRWWCSRWHAVAVAVAVTD